VIIPIVYGWGNVKRTYVTDVARLTCPRCQVKGAWGLWRITKRATLYWIPVLPYSSHHVLFCPYCEAGIELTRGQLREVRAFLLDPSTVPSFFGSRPASPKTPQTTPASPRQPMAVARFGPNSGWSGKAITFENEQFLLQGHGPLLADHVVDYDRQGHLIWPYDGMRAWVYGKATSTSVLR